MAACRTQALHEFAGAEKVDTGHRTLDARTPDARTPDGRRLDAYRTLDGRTPDTRTLAQDADMATKAR